VLDAGLPGVLMAMVASQLVYLVAAVLIARVRFCKPELKKDIALWKFLIIQSLPIGASGFFNTTYHQMNTLFLSGFRTTLEVGLYNGPYRIIRELLLLPLLLMRAPFPIISRLYHFAPNSLPVVAGQLFKLSLAAGLPLGVVTGLLADEIIILVLGSEFSAGAYVLRYFSGVIAMMFPALFAATLLLAMDRQNLVALLAGGCVGINAVLNLFFVPYMGGVGACLSTLLATGGMFVGFTVCMCKYLRGLSFSQIALEPCVGALALALVLVLLRPYSLVLALCAGFLLYAGIMVAVTFLFSKWHLKSFLESIRQV
jgi:O-antigen/teichoic acid export membrane protein